ncbi:DEAD/DEAH box helicase [Myroides odoratimimus]|uniref:DEAD/DEAH box helicase n=1 Tax=Myroides odoratimimus TaxID=76832 RepID=UPI002578FC17|nr:DEAD/DEAH box helicase [Myroides odoratimimus]
MKFQAGYILDGVSKIINEHFVEESFFNDFTKHEDINKLKGLLRTISCFDVNLDHLPKLDYDDIHPVLAVVNNIISRGLPTRAPIVLEEIFKSLKINISNKKKPFESRYILSDQTLEYNDVFELLHIIKPSLDINREQYGGDLDSTLEWNFIKDYPIFKQIFESQRLFSTLSKNLQGKRRFDFSYTIPYCASSDKRVDYFYETAIFEVDGVHHLINEYVYYDKLRDTLLEKVDANVFRFSMFEIQNNVKSISDHFQKDLLDVFHKNYNRDYKSELVKYSLVLVPFVVARIQKTLIELFIRDKSLLEKDILKIAVIERDLPGAIIAIEHLKDVITNLNQLISDKQQLILPDLQVELFQDESWVLDSSLNFDCKAKHINEFNIEGYDLVLDSSVLIRQNILKNDYKESSIYYQIRSSHYVDTTTESSRVIYSSKSLDYKALVVKNDDTSYSNVKELEPYITFFLREIFRKKSFREGQLPIISRALQRLPVIGLLPTGGGKSLTFQIPVFLQPGLAIVVDPIKSLMEDQVRVLKENWIDSATYVNSSLKEYNKNKNLLEFLLAGKQVLFVSPERFVIDSFRQGISNIDFYGQGQSISYCVIDEVHCVSEWGHDFRTDYLMIGENAQKYAFNKDYEESTVSLIGLTATASFDVLADIERELKIESDQVADSIIMIENTVRPELFFRVVDVTGIENRGDKLVEELIAFPDTFSRFNNPEVLHKSQLHHFENFDPNDFCKKDDNNNTYKNENSQLEFAFKPEMQLEVLPENFASVTFCLVKGESESEHNIFKNKAGVRSIQNMLTRHGFKAQYYYGTDNESTQEIVQDNFIDFTTGRTDHMVCTKAFGMGIDKDDIRATFHINYSSSLESLVQECGRAGRDKKVALASILASTERKLQFDIIKIRDISIKKYDGFLSSFDIVIIQRSLVSYADEKGQWKERFFDTKEHALSYITKINYSFTSKKGNLCELDGFKVIQLIKLLTDNIDVLLVENRADRKTHDFFYTSNFRGHSFEKSHIFNLFYKKEFVNNDFEQLELKEDFIATDKKEKLSFIIRFSNDYEEYKDKIIDKYIDINSIAATKNKSKESISEKLNEIFKSRGTLDEFWFELGQEDILYVHKIDQKTKKDIENVFFRYRSEQDTGRLIYRLHAVGLLESYTKDYNKQFYYCELVCHPNIGPYLTSLENFLRRYQSEQSVQASMAELEKKLKLTKESIVDDLIELLWYVVDFTYQEIAQKRLRATDEIEGIMKTMISNEDDLSEYELNLYLKEQIYYYFNAKYARPGYRESDIDCSLLDDYQLYQDGQLIASEVLYKFIDNKIIKNGTEQNNYKHLLGSCKKILFSLTESDLKKEWILRLLQAFALYSSNNISYRSQANLIVEKGFTCLLFDNSLHETESIIDIFEFYFDRLIDNIDEQNSLLEDIDLIKNKLLQSIQAFEIEKMLNKFYQNI